MSDKCVFYRSDNNCAALVTKRCGGCAFFKTAEQLEEGRRRSEARIERLPRQKREHIKETYRSSRGGGGDV